MSKQGAFERCCGLISFGLSLQKQWFALSQLINRQTAGSSWRFPATALYEVAISNRGAVYLGACSPLVYLSTVKSRPVNTVTPAQASHPALPSSSCYVCSAWVPVTSLMSLFALRSSIKSPAYDQGGVMSNLNPGTSKMSFLDIL